MVTTCDAPTTDSPCEDRITSKDQLVRWMETAGKPREKWRIGTEHEKLVYRRDTFRPLAYDSQPGIRDVLELFSAYGWKPKYEGENLIALTQPDGASITLEPGGQLELSGAPLRSIHETCTEVTTHLRQAKEVCDKLSISMLGLGVNPLWTREDIPAMPKGRYDIMTRHMPRVGTMGLDMMYRTCTVQVNLDFASEQDMVDKMRVSLALQPIATALFANSPFLEGRLNGFQSYRSHIWTDTDPARTGDLPFVFEEGFGFERYIDYLLDVPMYFVAREGRFIDAAGQSFRDFMAGALPSLPGELPTWSDWEDHLTVSFPEVRLKKYIEMRGADGGPWRSLCALPALWVGLLYDDQALEECLSLIADWTQEDRAHLRVQVPVHGFRTQLGDRTVLDISRYVLDIARQGLRRRASQDAIGHDETGFLTILQERVDRGQSMADELIAKFQGPWGGRIEPIFSEYAY